MFDFHLPETKTTPEVAFKIDGNLSIKGRCITRNAIKFFSPLLEWLRAYEGNHINLQLSIDYLDTASSRQLIIFLKEMEDRAELTSVKVTWNYEEDDDDMLETGKYFESLLDTINFTYKELPQLI